MPMIYKFRVIVDAEEDIFRDFEIEDKASLEELHHAIKKYVGFQGNEMASFFLADDEWIQGEEIALLNMHEKKKGQRLMSNTALKTILSEENNKLIYVYDFLNLWTCYVELMKIDKKERKKTYPNLLFAHGALPLQPVAKTRLEDVSRGFDSPGKGIDTHPYNDLHFEEHWN